MPEFGHRHSCLISIYTLSLFIKMFSAAPIDLIFIVLYVYTSYFLKLIFATCNVKKIIIMSSIVDIPIAKFNKHNI